MVGYVFWAVVVCYLSVCAGLLNQVNSAKELKKAKPFILFIPLVYILLLLKSVFRFGIKRDRNSKIIARGYFHFKIALLIMLFSFSQVQNEVYLEKKRRPKKYIPLSFAELIKAASDRTWNNMECATA